MHAAGSQLPQRAPGEIIMLPSRLRATSAFICSYTLAWREATRSWNLLPLAALTRSATVPWHVEAWRNAMGSLAGFLYSSNGPPPPPARSAAQGPPGSPGGSRGPLGGHGASLALSKVSKMPSMASKTV